MAARQFYSNQSLGAQSHTGDTVLTDALSLTFTPDSSSDYYLFASCERSINSTTNTVEADVVNSTAATTLASQLSLEKTSGGWIATGVVNKETFGVGPAAQTYKIQYKTSNSASTAQVRDCNLVAVKKAATDVDSFVAGPITGTNTTFADVSGGPSVNVGAGTWLILAFAEVSNSGSANFTRVQLTDGTNNYGTVSLPAISASATVYKAWFTGVKVTVGGSTTYKLQTNASAGTWGTKRLSVVAIDLSTLANNGYQADLTRSSVVGPSGAWTTKSTIGYTPPAGSLNHLLVQGMMLDGSASGANVQGRSTVGGVSEWANNDTVNSAFSTLEGQVAFGFQVASLAAGSTTITNDFTGTSGASTIGCASSVISILQLDASSTTFTGTAAQTLPSFTQSAAGTFVKPTYTGTSAQTLPSCSQSAAGTFTKPVYTGTSAQTLPSFTQSATGTFVKPTYTGTSAQLLPSFTQTAAGTFTKPVYTGTSAQTLPSFTQSATGTFTKPVYTGTSAQALPSFTQAAAGTFVKPTYTGTSAQTLPSFTQVATGTFTKPVYAGTSAQTLPSFSQVATGTFAVPVFTGTADQTLPSFTQTGTGAFTAPVYTGTSTQALPSFTQQAAGTFTLSAVTGIAAQTLPSFTQSATGTVAPPTFTGTSAQTIRSFSQSAAGTFVKPVYTGTSAQTLPSMSQAATGTATPPVYTAVAASVLPGITQQATGTFTDNSVKASLVATDTAFGVLVDTDQLLPQVTSADRIAVLTPTTALVPHITAADRLAAVIEGGDQ